MIILQAFKEADLEVQWENGEFLKPIVRWEKVISVNIK